MENKWKIAVLVFLLALLYLIKSTDNVNPPPARETKGTAPPARKTKAPSASKVRSSTVDLKAAVTFTGTQFVIQNNDSFDWSNVELEINPGFLSSGYSLDVKRMGAGETYTAGALQFAKSDGERFNPFTHKPKKLSIWSDTPQGRGFYMGWWE